MEKLLLLELSLIEIAGRSRGFGFVEMATPESAQNILNHFMTRKISESKN